LTHRHISQRTAAERLSQQTGDEWSQSKVHKILTGQVQLLADDLADLAALAHLSMVDLVREPGREFVADLTPSELKLLEAVRDAPRMLPIVLDLIGEAERRKPGRRTIRERMKRKE
jgi:hypothetical protein